MHPYSSAVVVAGGPLPPLDWARPILTQANRLVCADSGWRLCHRCQVRPEIVIGDLDSLDHGEIGELQAQRITVQRHPVDKNESDLHLALAFLAESYQGPVDILGALGGRLDHTLFNVSSILLLARELGLRARLLEPDTVVLALERELRLQGCSGRHCSILPLSAELKGISLQGFRYGLQRETLSRIETRGLSNVIEEDPACLTLEEGEGLLVITWQEVD